MPSLAVLSTCGPARDRAGLSYLHSGCRQLGSIVKWSLTKTESDELNSGSFATIPGGIGQSSLWVETENFGRPLLHEARTVIVVLCRLNTAVIRLEESRCTEPDQPSADWAEK